MILQRMRLKEEITRRFLTNREIDATTATPTVYLHSTHQTEAIGDKEEGYVIIPNGMDWRTIRL